MANAYPKRKQYEHENEIEEMSLEEGHIPDAVSVYERPEHSRLSPIAITVLAVLLLVIMATAALLFLV